MMLLIDILVTEVGIKSQKSLLCCNAHSGQTIRKLAYLFINSLVFVPTESPTYMLTLMIYFDVFNLDTHWVAIKEALASSL